MTSWMLVSNDDFPVDANVSVARRMHKHTSQGIHGSDDLAGELDDIDDVLLLLLTKFHVVLVTPESSAKDDGGTALSANKPRKTRKTTWKDNNTVKVKALNSELAIEGMTRSFCTINI